MCKMLSVAATESNKNNGQYLRQAIVGRAARERPRPSRLRGVISTTTAFSRKRCCDRKEGAFYFRIIELGRLQSSMGVIGS
jgi:hypothetical protein